jgi:hypothetical protein
LISFLSNSNKASFWWRIAWRKPTTATLI